MPLSRRDCCLLFLPALLARALPAAGTRLVSRAYRFEDLPVRTRGANRSRAVLDGRTHEGQAVELHETQLAPGSQPHPPHRHVHEEVFLVREGTVEVTISGRTTRLGPGSVAYVASNDEHGARNVGTTPAQYFVIALGTKKPQAGK